MENIHGIFLFSHIAAGMMALISGILPMVSKKGGKLHRITGKLFFWSMFWVFISSILSFFFFRGNFFLLVVGIFSFHMCFTGYRVLYRKQPGSETWVDWAGAIITVIAGIGVEIYGIYLFQKHGSQPIVILSMIFGFFTVQNGYADIKMFRMKEMDSKMWWFYHHINAFCGAFIAALTAFLVNAVSRHLTGHFVWMIWMLPVLLATPGIVFWIRYYKRKFGDLPKKKSTGKHVMPSEL